MICVTDCAVPSDISAQHSLTATSHGCCQAGQFSRSGRSILCAPEQEEGLNLFGLGGPADCTHIRDIGFQTVLHNINRPSLVHHKELRTVM